MMTFDTNHSELTMTLDGETVTFIQGETVYDVAARHGRFVPTLCYDERLQPFGACRLCIVEVKGQRNPMASCTTPAAHNMEANTSSPNVDLLRKTLLEMVISENPALEVSPLRSYSSQELFALAEHYGAERERFRGAYSGESRTDDHNPFLLRDYNLCISCYRCVRVCAEQEGDYAISIKNRGFQTQITVEFDGLLEESACTFCGQCVQTCPTGALGDKKAMRNSC